MSENKNKGISSSRTSEIWLADIWHRQQPVRYFPLGIGYIAAYSQKIFGDRFSFRLFTDPDQFIRQFYEGKPLLVGMRNDMANIRLNDELITRLKKLHPDTVTVMGGPNFPLEPEKQAEYLKARPLLDFYIFKDGEVPFAELLKHLLDFHFDAKELKRSRSEIPGVHYLSDGRMIAGELKHHFQTSLDDIPSPYLGGLLDPFFEEGLFPLVQATRGCPFSCSYCVEGNIYFSRIRRFSPDRLKSELNYIADRPDKRDLIFLTDSNFGMYKEDIGTAELIAGIQKTKGWPKKLFISSGKNEKENVSDAFSRFVPGTAMYSASMQSTDPGVLENVRRKNVSLSVLMEMSVEAEKYGWTSYTELILGLPGDSTASHLKSLRTVIEAGVIRHILIFPLYILPGSELDTAEYRQRFQIVPYFTVLRKSTGQYRFGAETVSISEIVEMGVVHSSMSLEDYLDCRMMDLSVILFYNHGCFYEAVSLLTHLNLSVFDFLEKCHRLVSGDPCNSLNRFYADIRAYGKKIMFETSEQAEKFFADPENVKEYAETEYKHYIEYARPVGVILYGEALHDIAQKALTGQLEAAGMLTEELRTYIAELFRFSLYRKKDPLNTELVFEDEFGFDFAELYRLKFQADPRKFLRTGKQRLRFVHSPGTAAEIKRVFPLPDMEIIFRQTMVGKNIDSFFREVEVAE